MRFTRTIDDSGVPGQLLYARPSERRLRAALTRVEAPADGRSGVEGTNLISYEQRPIADAEGPGPAPSWPAGYPAAPSAGQPEYGWQSPAGPPVCGYPPPPGTGARRPRALWYVIAGIGTLIVTAIRRNRRITLQPTLN